MSDEWQDWESAAIEYELQREGERPADGCGCAGCLPAVFIGFVVLYVLGFAISFL